MKFISLFAGIGGLDLGLERAGMECVAQVEIDPFCQRVLTKHWPNVPKFKDVHDVGKHNLPKADLICGGFPCQPHSYAGKRKGKADDRNLWPEYLRIIKELQPGFVVGENVPGIITTIFDEIISDLEGIGYTCQKFIIPACAFNAPHRRNRVFVVAYSNSSRYVHGQLEKQSAERGVKARGESIASGENVADTHRTHGEGNKRTFGSIETRTEFVESGWWSVEPAVGRTLDGFSSWLDRHRELTNEAHERIMANVYHLGDKHDTNDAKERADQVLRELRNKVGEEDIRRSSGGFRSISEKEILFAYLCKLEETSFTLGDISLAGKEVSGDGMRGVRNKNKSTSAPHRSESEEQRTIEYTNSLQALSRFLAHHSQKAWSYYRRENAKTILNAWGDGWEQGIPRVANGVPRRVDRLRGLGNAVVPQVAEFIGRCIMTAASRD